MTGALFDDVDDDGKGIQKTNTNTHFKFDAKQNSHYNGKRVWHACNVIIIIMHCNINQSAYIARTSARAPATTVQKIQTHKPKPAPV